MEQREFERAEASLLQALGAGWIELIESEPKEPIGVTRPHFQIQAPDDGALQATPPLLKKGGVEGGVSNYRLFDGIASLDANAARRISYPLEHLGRLYRRLEAPLRAFRVHLRAFEIRRSVGSSEEMWETACSLGLDAEVDKHFDAALTWFQAAVELAGACGAQAEPFKAQALHHLCSCLMDRGDMEAAIHAARSALDCLRRYDPGGLATVRAELKLSHVLVQWGRTLYEKDAHTASGILNEAVERLSSVEEELRAFGIPAMQDVRSCMDWRDFAERLRMSLTAACTEQPEVKGEIRVAAS
jgi:tetratricopeptide (TPR) repeat protein